MNIMPFIFWFIAFGNSLFAQGYTYDLVNNRFVPPATITQSAPARPETSRNRTAR
jgi:hypothetical protein